MIWTDDEPRFSILGFAPEGSVFFSYNLEGSDWPASAQGFTSNAQGDLDGNSSMSTYYITSNDTEIRHTGVAF